MFSQQLSHAAKLAVQRSPLAPMLRRLFSSRSSLTPALEVARKEGWPRGAQWLLAQGRSLLRNRYLLDGLRYDINRDTDVELLLTEVRKALLEKPSILLDDAVLHVFAEALIQQCINNEYVWFVSETERQRINRLSEDVPLTTDPWPKLGVLALYQPLHELLALGVSPAPPTDLSWLQALPDVLQGLVRTYVGAYEEEMTIKRSIKSFGTIRDDVSRKVAAMYEVYPYPRWINLVKPAPGTRQTWLKEFFAGQKLEFLNRPFDVLVAGCGTGRKAIQIALGFGEQARVLATDLSRASLAYATRMARQHRVKNIDFLQMDILDLPQFGQQFDVVECTGVLHHMEEPVQGGKAIVSRLRPNGIAHISLYSELARREIVRLRSEYEQQISTIDVDYVRRYRRRLMLEQPGIIDTLPTRGDFFDLSRCKDLLFHPVEQRFTIPLLELFLSQIGVEFQGFEQPKLIQNRYWTRLPSDRRNLDRWSDFEQRYPDAFQDLYEIWARKPSPVDD